MALGEPAQDESRSSTRTIGAINRTAARASLVKARAAFFCAAKSDARAGKVD